MPLILIATFAICLAIVLGMYWTFVVRLEDKSTRAIRSRLSARPVDRPTRGQLMKKEASLSALKVLDNVLARSGSLIDPLRQAIANSALPLTVGVVLLACGFAGAIAFFLITALTSSVWFGAIVGLIFTPAPFIYVRYAAAKRMSKFEEQLPQAVDMIAVSLRAGHAFTTGLLMTAEELPDPLGAEFRLLYDQQNYGKPLPDVLKEFAERVPLLDARIFVTAVLTQRETGGNLAEVLDRLAAVIRERFRVRRQVRAMSAHGRITGWVLGLLPPVLGGLLFLIAPAHMSPLVDDPFGRELVAAAVVLQVIGMVMIRRIVNVEF
jgi:tight adherence protein B